MKIKWSVSKSPASAFVGTGGDDAWACYFYVGRCFEPKAPTLRAWQIKILWLEVSAWWESKPQSVSVVHGGLALRALAILALLSLPGCAFSARTIGQHDPTVEAIKALTEVLKAHPAPPLEATPSPSPSPTGTPQERLESQAAGFFLRPENLRTVEASPEGGK